MSQGGTTNNGINLPLAVTQGGTGLTTLVTNGLLYAPTTTTISQITVQNNGVFVTDNSGVPSCLVGPGVSNYALLSVVSAAPAWSSVPYPSATGWTTYTPTVTLVGGAGNATPTYSTTSGRYSQTGNVISVSVVLINSSAGTAGAGTGQINIALPVTSGASVAATTASNIGYSLNNATADILIGTIGAGSTTIALSYFSTISAISNLTGADQNHANIREIHITFFYEV